LESTERTDIVPDSTEPATKLILYYHPSSIGYSLEGLQSITKEENEETLKISEIRKQNPVDSFRYALKSSEATRQYPKKLKMLFLGYKLAYSEKGDEYKKEAESTGTIG
jgi:hypothetical protein